VGGEGVREIGKEERALLHRMHATREAEKRVSQVWNRDLEETNFQRYIEDRREEKRGPPTAFGKKAKIIEKGPILADMEETPTKWGRGKN